MEQVEEQATEKFSKEEILILSIVLYLLGFAAIQWGTADQFQRRGVAGLFVLIVAASFFPRLLRPLEWVWVRVAKLFHYVVQTLLWGALYFLIFVPFAVLSRVFRGDLLRAKWKQYDSTWMIEPDSLQTIDYLRKAY